jgi:thiamine pyrophosphokinase
MNTCYIACALDCVIDFTADKSDLIIGADRGYLNLIKQGTKPHIVMGDFDSYTGEIECDDIVKFPPIKDDTDSAIAIKYAVEQGYKKIVVYGAIGGDLDHTIANIAHLAKYTESGIDISFVDRDKVLFALHNSKVKFLNEAKGRISVFAFTEKAEGVYEKGLFYTLDDATLYSNIPLGVSNEFTGKESEISVENGTLLIYTSKENYEKYLTK